MAEQTAAENAAQRTKLYLTITLAIQCLLTAAIVWYALLGDWQNMFLTAIVIALTLLPAVLHRRYSVLIPAEFQLVSAAFIFLSLFLGSAVDLYYHFWWWDIVLHSSSGFLLGIIGFLAIFLLNQTDKIPVGMKPAFVCFFAVTFAVFLGVVWETFEFAVDQMWPSINMQSNETGVVDTMQDLIVDMIGATVVAVMGWGYLKTGRYSFLMDGINEFIAKNPTLFGKLRRKKHKQS